MKAWRKLISTPGRAWDKAFWKMTKRKPRQRRAWIHKPRHWGFEGSSLGQMLQTEAFGF